MKGIKSFFKKVYDLKFHILSFILAFFIFFRIFFPDRLLISFVFDTLSKTTPFVYDYQDASLSFFPNLGINADYLKLYKEKSKPLILTDISLTTSLPSLLFLSPELDFKTKVFNGRLTGYASELPIVLDKASSFLLNIVLEHVDLSQILKELIPSYMNIEVSSILSGSIDGEVYPLKQDSSSFSLDLLFTKVHLFPTKIFDLDIPEIKVKKASLQGMIVKSVFNIKKFVLGSEKEDLFLTVSGKVALKYNRPYDLRIRLTSKGKVKDLLDLALLSLGAKEKNSYFTFRITGDSKNPIPQIKPE